VSRIENRPDPNAEASRPTGRDGRQDAPPVAGEGGGTFKKRLLSDSPPAKPEPAPEIGSEDLPVLVRPLPEGETVPPRRPLPVEGEPAPPAGSAGTPEPLAPSEGRMKADAPSTRELEVEPTVVLPRRARATEDDPRAAAELGSGLPPSGPPLPATPPAVQAVPGPARTLDPALLQQVVEFAAVTRNSEGQRELVLGTNRNLLGGATLRLVALGAGRIALRYRPGSDLHAAREGISSLARTMRERGVELVDVEEEGSRG